MTKRAPVVAVVDDEDDVRLALRRLLRSAGYDVLAYESGSEFLRHAATSLPDCVVLDLRMPGPSGFEVQASLRAQQLTIPVVVLSADDSTASRHQALAGGADAYLCKPVDGDALINATQAAIERCARQHPSSPHGRPESP